MGSPRTGLPALTVYFDAFLARDLRIIRLSPGDDYGLYAIGRRNFFGTTLAARGTKAEIERERDRCAMR